MDTLVRLLPSPAFGVPALVLVVYLLYTRLTTKPHSANVPWIGKEPEKVFSETRAHLKSFGNVREWLAEGYEKVKASPFPVNARSMVCTNEHCNSTRN